MIQKIPLIKDNTVINVSVQDTDKEKIEPPEGCTFGLEGGNIGDTTTDGGKTYIRPEPEVIIISELDQANRDLMRLDRVMPRGTEDLMTALIAKGVLTLDDFDTYSLENYNKKAAARARRKKAIDAT